MLEDRTLLSAFSISDVTAVETDSGTTNFVFTVSRDDNTNAETVDYQTADGTAAAGSDFTGIGVTTLNFGAGGDLSKLVTVVVSGDQTVEADETFFVNLSNATNGATIADNQGQGTITNDDTATLSIGNVTQVETNSGTTNFVFTVTLDQAVQGGVNVDFASANGTAIAGTDYTTNSGTLSFTGNAGETQTATIVVNGDQTVEADETFTVGLSSVAAQGAGVDSADITAGGAATGTITNDDTATLTIGNVTQVETNSGTTNFVFTVTLDQAVQGGVNVDFASANGTAIAGTDYTTNSGTLNFTGNAGETQTATIVVSGDQTVEADETFTVGLSSVAAQGAGVDSADITAGGAATGTITNDDTATLSIGNVTQVETNSGTTNFVFTVTLDQAVQGGVNVDFASANGTAIAGTDYTTNSGTLNFTGNAGETQTATIVVSGDQTEEPNETFTVGLSSVAAQGAGVDSADITAGGAATGTITNDDTATLSIGNVTQVETNSGTTNFVFTVTLDQAVQGGVNVDFASANGTATAGSDYTANSGTLNFTGNAGETQTATIVVSGDQTEEPNETFTVGLSSVAAQGAGVDSSDITAGGAATGTILNDDTALAPSRPQFTGPHMDIMDNTPVFAWVDNGGADYYELIVYNVATGQKAVDAIGIAATHYAVPSALGAPIDLQAFVRGHNSSGVGQWSTALTTTIRANSNNTTTPQLTGPMNQINDATPTITWMQIASATSYNVKVFTQNGTLVADGANVTETHFTTGKLASGTYQAYVQSNVSGGTSAWSGPLFFRIHGSAPSIAAPTFSAPSSPTADTTPTFEWSPEYGANDFELLIYNASTGQVVLNTLTGGPSYTPMNPLASGQYEVYVRGINADSQAGDWGRFDLQITANESTPEKLVDPETKPELESLEVPAAVIAADGRPDQEPAVDAAIPAGPEDHFHLRIDSITGFDRDETASACSPRLSNSVASAETTPGVEEIERESLPLLDDCFARIDIHDDESESASLAGAVPLVLATGWHVAKARKNRTRQSKPKRRS